jgi:hypothetical protein
VVAEVVYVPDATQSNSLQVFSEQPFSHLRLRNSTGAVPFRKLEFHGFQSD